MTDEDRDYLRGWQAASRGDPFDPYETEKWREAYVRWLVYRITKDGLAIQGLAGNWTYSYPEHAMLLKIYEREVAELQALERRSA